VPLLILFISIALGLLLGRIKLGGLSLGSSGVLFVALLFGHLGYTVPPGLGDLGLVLFVYCVGITAGPSFFRAFVRQGRDLAKLVGVLVVAAGAASWLAARWLALPRDLVVGLFAGSMTSTPALAAAMERLPAGSEAAVGYGIAYPFGVVGVVLFVQVLPRVLGVDLTALARDLGARETGGRKIVRALIEVINPAVIGRHLRDLEFIAESNCQISRQLRGDRLIPVEADLRLEEGQHLLLVGREFRVERLIPLLGRRSERTDYVMDTEQQRVQVIVGSREMVGHKLRDLSLLTRYGVTISRITRHDLEFVPDLDDEIEYADALSAVGEPENLERFAQAAGHRAKSFDETDIISLGIGIIAGIILGMVEVKLGGTSVRLGMAGGPLFVALLLGHFGRVGGVVGHLPRASRLLMMEIGLVLFLANAGMSAGGQVLGVIQAHGINVALAGVAVTMIPMVVGYFFARYALKMNLLQVIGGVCGGMTSTPALGTITAKVDSEIPVVSYAAAYPVALILLTVAAQALISILS
jgi:putative transport protein